MAARLVWLVYQRLQALACRASDVTVFQNHDDARQFIADGIVKSQKAKVILGSHRMSSRRLSTSEPPTRITLGKAGGTRSTLPCVAADRLCAPLRPRFQPG